MSRANHFSFGGLIFPSCITVYFGTKTFYGNCKFRHETVKEQFTGGLLECSGSGMKGIKTACIGSEKKNMTGRKLNSHHICPESRSCSLVWFYAFSVFWIIEHCWLEMIKKRIRDLLYSCYAVFLHDHHYVFSRHKGHVWRTFWK